MIRGIHHVAVHTADLDRLRTFYQEAFGFEPVGEEMRLEDLPGNSEVTGVDGAAARIQMLRTPNGFLELFEWSTPRPDSTRALQAYDIGYTHLCVQVSDIDHEYLRLRALGMTFVSPAPVHFGGLAAVYGFDPDGNIIEIAQFSSENPLNLLSAGTVTAGV